MRYGKGTRYTILDGHVEKSIIEGAYVYVYNRTNRTLECLDNSIVVIRESKILMICQDPSHVENLTDINGTHILEKAKEDGTYFRLTHGELILPGFIDMHVHGGGGRGVDEATCDAIKAMSLSHVLRGTTTIVPTTVTAPMEKIKQCLRVIAKFTYRRPRNGAHIEGSHLESNYLSEIKAGIHPLPELRAPDVDELMEYIAASIDPNSSAMTLRIVTYAPERDEDYIFTRVLQRHGVIPSIGHTNASRDQILEALQRGAYMICHFPNALSSSRRPPFGAVEGVLEGLKRGYSIMVEVIADGVHVSPDVIRDTIYPRHYKAPDRNYDSNLVLVSDALGPAGSGLTEFTLAGMPCKVCQNVEDNGRRYPAGYLIDNTKPKSNWTLAGSVITLRDAVLNMAEWLDDFEVAVKLATINPARALGVSDQRGAIVPGHYADIVVYDSRETLEPRYIFVEGELVDIEEARKQLSRLVARRGRLSETLAA